MFWKGQLWAVLSGSNYIADQLLFEVITGWISKAVVSAERKIVPLYVRAKGFLSSSLRSSITLFM